MSQTLNERDHPRTFRDNACVYPVLSRRAGGISVGVNLNPDKSCTFRCVYCQVVRDTKRPLQPPRVALPGLSAELRAVLEGLAPGGALWQAAEFAALPPEKKRVCDIAFSGDGEPTMVAGFAAFVEACVAVKESFRPVYADAKVVLITNATGLDRPEVRHTLEWLDEHNGEVWAKLDVGTPEQFKRINGTSFPFVQVLGNIWTCARARPTVIQSCFARLNGAGPSEAELTAYVARLKEIVAQGGMLKLVQVYTVARPPAGPGVASLSDAEVDAIAARVRTETGLRAEAYHGQVSA
jgi:wyosine [tRNA(Phe)-imidazoG37] synthetase (radical SAM superfamily)